MWFEAPPPNYRVRGYYKSGYQEPEPTRDTPVQKNYRHISKFTGAGVERDTQAKGFAYGSETEYQNSRKSYGRPRDNIIDRT